MLNVSENTMLMTLSLIFMTQAALQPELDLGTGIAAYDYAERLSYPLKSTERGILPSIGVGFGFNAPSSAFFMHIKARMGMGSTKYDGSTQQGEPLIAQTQNRMLDAQARFGVDLVPSPVIGIIPNAGVGYHQWMRALGGGGNSGGYTEYYSWYHAPVGMRFEYWPTERLLIGLDANVRPMFGGEIAVKLSDIDPSYKDVVARIGNRPAYHASLPIKIFFGGQSGLGLKPWYQISTIGEDERFPIETNRGLVAGYGVEPPSLTRQYGLEISWQYRF